MRGPVNSIEVKRTSVYYLLTMKICQPIEDAFRYFAKHFLSRPTAKLLDFPVYAV